MSDVRIVYRNPVVACPDPSETRTVVRVVASPPRQVVTTRGTIGGKGDEGDTGPPIELQVSGGFIEWRVEGDTDWIQLIDVDSLVGEPGGAGPPIELQVSGTDIEWRVAGSLDAWTPLIALSELAGEDGSDANVTNTNVNAAIEKNRAATRASLELQEAATAPTAPLGLEVLDADTPEKIRAAANAASSTAGIDLYSVTASLTAAAWKPVFKYTVSILVPATISVGTSTGYARMIRWDGVAGTNSPVSGGNPATGITPALGENPLAPYNSRMPKFLGCYATTSGGVASGNLTWISCASKSITAMDISGLPALQTLACNNNFLTNLDASGLTAFTSLVCNTNLLRYLSVQGCSALQELNCSYNSLDALDVSGLASLATLDCRNNVLRFLDISSCPQLSSINCTYNNITSLDASGLVSLETLSCEGNQLTTLLVGGCINLTTLAANSNSITALDASNLPQLYTLSCTNNQLVSLNVSGCTSLFTLNLTNNPLTTLTLGNHPTIDTLQLSQTSITALDLNGVSNVRLLGISYIDFTTAPDFTLLTNVGELWLTGVTGVTTVDLSNSTRHNLFVDSPGPCSVESLILPAVTGVVLIVGSSILNVPSLTSVRCPGANFLYVRLNVGMDAAALNQFFTDLAPGTALLEIEGCPGAATCDRSIATDKGYTFAIT